MTDAKHDQEEAHTGADDRKEEKGASTENLQKEFRRAREDTAAVVEDLRGLREELAALLRDRLRSQPYLTLGASTGIGYVLGGGLPKGVPTLAIGLATRMAAGWLMREIGGTGFARDSSPTEEEL